MAEKTTSFTGPIVVGLNEKKGEIRLTDGKDVNEAKYLSIAAPENITSNTTLTFPDGAGTAGQILSTDGNGGLNWVNDSAGNPAGTNGQVQTNDGGTFGAISEGTSGQVLTSNGAGSAPTFQAAAGGGIDTSGPAWLNTGDSVFLESTGQNNPTNYSNSIRINSGSIFLDGLLKDFEVSDAHKRHCLKHKRPTLNIVLQGTPSSLAIGFGASERAAP